MIGDPIAHSLSPVLHNAAFAALELDWAYLAFEVPAESAADAIAGMRAFGIDGLSVTMPHKSAVAAAVDELTAVAEALGSVNTVVRHGGTLVGHSTDGAGLVAALRADEGFDPLGARCVVLGAGGAARAVVHALAEAGSAKVAVAARVRGKAEVAATLAGHRGQVVDVLEQEVREADLIINATPVGMGNAGIPFEVSSAWLGAGQVVVDLVYDPPVTPLLLLARERGAVAVNGLGMLIHQAAAAFRLWTGEDPPLEVMSAAAAGALAHRRDQTD